MTTYKCREDYVLIRIVDMEMEGGVAMPESSFMGKEFMVQAIGPLVENLQVGDRVLMLGRKDVTYFELPSTSKLIVMRQEHVCLVLEG